MWKSEEFYNAITYHGVRDPAQTWIRIDSINGDKKVQEIIDKLEYDSEVVRYQLKLNNYGPLLLTNLITDKNKKINLPVELEKLEPGEIVTLSTPWYELQNNQTYAELMLANPVIKVDDKEFRYIFKPYEDN